MALLNLKLNIKDEENIIKKFNNTKFINTKFNTNFRI